MGEDGGGSAPVAAGRGVAQRSLSPAQPRRRAGRGGGGLGAAHRGAWEHWEQRGSPSGQLKKAAVAPSCASKPLGPSEERAHRHELKKMK